MTQSWDLLIKGAKVFDGSGALPSIQDVAVRNGKVAARGENLPSDAATQVIDGSNQWLVPGMLDIHTHLDLEVDVEPALPEVVRHGTTTVLVGNCSLGTSFGTQQSGEQEPIVDCFTRVENIPKTVLRKVAEKVTWDNTGDYMDHFDDLPLGPNIAAFVPHSMLRIEVMGLEASVSRKPTEAELRKMEELLEAPLVHRQYIDNEAARLGAIRCYSPILPSLKIIMALVAWDFLNQSWPWYARVPTTANCADGPSRMTTDSIPSSLGVRVVPPILPIGTSCSSVLICCLLYTSPSPRDQRGSRMPSWA